MKLSLYKQLVRNGEDSEAIFNPGEMGAKLFDVKTEGMLRLNPDFGRMLCLLWTLEITPPASMPVSRV